MLEIIDGAPIQGLKPSLFLKGDLPKDKDARELALTKAALSYASALAQGYSDPKEVSAIYSLPRPKVDVASGLADALARRDGLTDWYASLPPQTDEYRALSDSFVRYAKLNDVQGNIPEGKLITPGSSDPRMPAIAKALVANGYLDGDPGSARHSSPAMVTAVKRLQSEYGIRPDGVVGDGTIAILNKGPGDRARQIAVNMAGSIGQSGSQANSVRSSERSRTSF